jgi:hypothetical protein
MLFLNEKGILENAASHSLRKLRRDAMDIWRQLIRERRSEGIL